MGKENPLKRDESFPNSHENSHGANRVGELGENWWYNVEFRSFQILWSGPIVPSARSVPLFNFINAKWGKGTNFAFCLRLP